MKKLTARFCMALLGILVLAAAVGAQTVYVSEDLEITMRTGPASDRKIIAMVKSGTTLEMLEKGEEWSLVRGPSGKEGWVLNRYIAASPPSALVLERMRKDHDALTAKYKELKERYEQLEAQKKAADGDVSQKGRSLDELNQAYETLKRESSDFLSLKQRHQETTAALEAEKTRSAKLDEENQEMQRSYIIQWVLTGGGILLVGFFIGLFSSSRRQPRSSLY